MSTFMIIFDWDGADDEATYIIPCTSQSSVSKTSSALSYNNSIKNITNLNNTFSNISVKTNMSLMYNDVCCENVLIPGQILNIPITITNSEAETLEIIPYIAKYDLSGKLIELNQCEQINALPDQTTSAVLSEDFDNDTVCTAKIFLWQKNTMVPITNSVCCTVQNQDYYADNYEQANEIDISKQICGVINTDSDIDIVKFTPTETGIYALQFDASNDTICGLYDNRQTLLNSVSALTDKGYLLYYLNSNQDYYIRFNGVKNNSYKITPALPTDIITLTKNIGVASNLSESYDFNVYKFTPTATDNYIITAVDSSNVNADLYNDSFEKVASGDVSDTSVSFRITNRMTANQTYYVVVYPKPENSFGAYTMYVEEPFTLLSVD